MGKFNIEKAIRLFLIGFNSLLWGALWLNFALNSTYLRSGYELPDDKYTVLVVVHRAASAAIYASDNWSYRGAFFVNSPSYLVTRLAFRLAFGSVYDVHQYMGTTVAGYELICWMIVSFLQWYLIGKMIGWLMRSKPHGVATAAN